MESRLENLVKHILDNKNTLTEFVLKEWLKEYSLEIAKEAFSSGFSYAVASHTGMKQIYLSKEQYIEKLKNEL